MKKVICECGSSKWRLKECFTYTSIPSIDVEMYECVECGKTYEKRIQQTMGEMYPEVEVFDNEPEKLVVETSGDFYGFSSGTGDITGTIINDTIINEPSKVTYKENEDEKE